MERTSSLTLKNVLIGYVLAIALTFAAYLAVIQHWLLGWALGALILTFAVIQLGVQMLCFIDLGFGAGRRWKIGTFIATMGSVLIIVGGSVWIMAHLNYNMMASPDAMTQYINGQQGF